MRLAVPSNRLMNGHTESLLNQCLVFSLYLYQGAGLCVEVYPSQLQPHLSLSPLLCSAGAVLAACRGLWKVTHTVKSTQPRHRGYDTNLISPRPTSNT